MFSKRAENESRKLTGIDLSGKIEFKSRRTFLQWWAPLLQALIVFMALFGTAYTFITLFQLPVSRFAVNASILIDTVLFSFIYKWQNVWKWAIPGTAIFCASAGWLFRLELTFGYKIIANMVVAGINRRSLLNLPSFIIGDIRDYSYYVSIFIIFALFLLSMAVAAFVVRKPSLPLLFLVTFPFAEIGLFFGIVPSYSAFFILLASWVAVCTMQISASVGKAAGKKQKQWFRRMSAGAGVTMAAILLLVSGVGYLVFSPEEYSRSKFMDDVRRDAQSLFSPDKKKRGEIISSGGTNGGKLGASDKIVYNHEKALNVVLPADAGSMYLKGYVGSVYTGSSWELLPEAKYQSNPNLFNNQEVCAKFRTLDSTYDKWLRVVNQSEVQPVYRPVTVQNIIAAKYAYIPYQSTFDSRDFILHYDTYAEKTADSYQFNVSEAMGKSPFENMILPLDVLGYNAGIGAEELEELNAFVELEREYHNFVYNNYTALPEQMSEKFLDEMWEFNRKASTTIMSDLVEDVRAYLSEHAFYSLEAGRLPEGKDFVDYFLYENHKGSCSHFASAAVLMFRYCGIPARYVEGYVLTQADIENGTARDDGTKQVEILDTNAHAWAEIYLDGYGWVPVEATPGFSGESINLPDEKKSTSSTQKSTTKKSTTGAVSTSQRKTTTHSSASTSTALGTTKAEQAGGKPGSFQAEKLLKLLLFIFMVSALVFTVLFLRHLWADSVRRNRLNLKNANRCIDCLYEEILKLLDYSGIQNENNLSPKGFSEYLDETYADTFPELFSPVMELILKAKYSKDGCTREEAKTVMHFTREFTRKIYASLPRSKQLSYRYIKNLYW